MATEFTPNYNLDKYTAQDKPNLRDQYNAAMDKIDLALLSANTNATEAKSATQSFQEQLDAKASKTELDTKASKTELQEAVEPLATKIALQNEVTARRESSGISFVGNYGAKEKTNNIDWQSIINDIAEVSNTIDFGNGQWFIDSEITIPQSIGFIVGNGAMLKATNSIRSILYYPNYAYNQQNRFVYFDGISFECDYKASNGIYSDAGNAVAVSCCRFNDFTESGITSTQLGVFILNSLFHQNETRVSETGPIGTGVKTTSDSFVSNCKFFHMRTAIEAAGVQISGCYFFANSRDSMYTTLLKNCIGFSVCNCEVDCINRIFYNCEDGVITNNYFYFNGRNDTITGTDKCFFYADKSNYDFKNINFSNNIIDCNPSDCVGKYVTFATNGVKTAVSGFYSARNAISDKLRNETNRSKFALTFGCVNKNAEVSTPYSLKFTKFTNPYKVGFMPSFGFEFDDGNVVFNTFHFTANSKLNILGANGHINASALKAYLPDTESDFYISANPMQFSVIKIPAGCPWNMEFAYSTETPSNFPTIIDSTVI